MHKLGSNTCGLFFIHDIMCHGGFILCAAEQPQPGQRDGGISVNQPAWSAHQIQESVSSYVHKMALLLQTPFYSRPQMVRWLWSQHFEQLTSCVLHHWYRCVGLYLVWGEIVMKILYLDVYLRSFPALISKNCFLTCVITRFDSRLQKNPNHMIPCWSDLAKRYNSMSRNGRSDKSGHLPVCSGSQPLCAVCPLFL